MPEGWKTVPIGDVLVNAQYGLNLPVTLDGTVPIIGMKDMIAGRVENNGWGCVDLAEGSCAKHLLRHGDILLNRTNSPDLVGKVALWDRSETAVFPSYIVRFRADEDRADAAFLNYVLNSDDGQTRLKALSTRGVSQANINPTTFRKAFALALPPVAEQRRIAAVLDEWDNAIIAAERLGGMSRIANQATLRRLLQDIPETELSDVATVIMGQSPPSASYCDVAIATAVPLVQGAADFDGPIILPQKATRQPTKIVSAPAVLMSVRAPVGTTAISRTEVCIGRGVCAIIPRAMSLELTSVLLEAASAYWRTVAQGGTFEAVGGAEVRSAPVPDIPGCLQEGLSGYATAMMQAVQHNDEKITLLRRQKRGLMQKLLTGKWRVSVTGDAFTPGGSAADQLEAAE